MKRALTDSSRLSFLGFAPLWLVMVVFVLGLRTPSLDAEESMTAGTLTLLDVARMTLEHDPNIVLAESRRDAGRGLLLSARSLFDPQLSASLTRDQSETPTSESTSNRSTGLSSSLDLTTLLRSGLSLEPSLTLSRGDGAISTNEATVSFTLRQPLLRDRGRDVVTASERAAEQELRARDFELRHEVSRRLLQVISSYWSYRSAAMNLEILRETEMRSLELLQTTRRLIEADLTPRAELVLLEADLASKESSRISGERRLFAARQDLGREIGLPSSEILDLPLPADPFPALRAERVPVDSMEIWIERSLLTRADLLAARERLIAAEMDLRAAANDLKPQLDLVLTPSYSGLVEGNGADDFFSPLFDNVPGFSTVVGLSFSFPTLNRRAEGARIQAEEARRQSAIGVALLENEVGSTVPISLDAVYRNALQVEKIALSVRLFEQTVENELKKLRAGSSTLIDVISQQDRLTSVQQQEIAAQLALAQALVDLRFQSGTLLDTDLDNRDLDNTVLDNTDLDSTDGRESLDVNRLTTLPFQDSSFPETP